MNGEILWIYEVIYQVERKYSFLLTFSIDGSKDDLISAEKDELEEQTKTNHETDRSVIWIQDSNNKSDSNLCKAETCEAKEILQI